MTRPGDQGGHVPAGLAYGPVRSRRFGMSLGVSCSPPGAVSCHWRCPYCQLAGLPEEPGSFATRDAILAETDALLARQTPGAFQVITLAGSGEPLDHPAFPALAADLAKRAAAAGVPLILLSNGDGLEDPERQAALAHFDQVWLKWDPGAPGGAWRRLPPGGAEARLALLTALAPRLRGGLGIQSLLFRSAAGGGNADEASRLRWLGAMTRLRPTAIQLGNAERSTERPGILPIEPGVLAAWIAAAQAAGLPVQATCA